MSCTNGWITNRDATTILTCSQLAGQALSNAAVIPFPTAFALGWREIRDTVREANALGVRFRVAGAGIAIEETAGELTARLRDKLGGHGGRRPIVLVLPPRGYR